MSDDYQYIDVNDEQFEGTPRALREALDRAQRALKAEKAATAELRSHQATNALSDVLTEFKNPERVKRDLLSDKVDPLDSEAVAKWLASNGDDYAKGEANAEPPASQTETSGQAPEGSAAHQQVTSISQIGSPHLADKVERIKNPPADVLAQGSDAVHRWLVAQGA